MRYKLILSLFFFPCLLMAQSSFQEGVHLFQQKKYEAAKVKFEAYLNQKPDDTASKEHLGDIASYEANWDTALKYYKNLVENYPNNARYNFKYGGALGLKALSISRVKALFYIDDIKKYLRKAAELDPEHIEARWSLVELFLKLPGILGGSVDTAEKYANQLLKISPLDGYLAKGRIAEYEENDLETKKYYLQALAWEGGNACAKRLDKESHNVKLKALETEKNKACINYSSNYLNYRIGKVCALYRVQVTRGIVCLKHYIDNYTAVDGFPLKWAYLNMAKLYKERQQKKQALAWVEKALANDHDFEYALKLKGAIQKM